MDMNFYLQNSLYVSLLMSAVAADKEKKKMANANTNVKKVNAAKAKEMNGTGTAGTVGHVTTATEKPKRRPGRPRKEEESLPLGVVKPPLMLARILNTNMEMATPTVRKRKEQERGLGRPPEGHGHGEKSLAAKTKPKVKNVTNTKRMGRPPKANAKANENNLTTEMEM